MESREFSQDRLQQQLKQAVINGGKREKKLHNKKNYNHMLQVTS